MFNLNGGIVYLVGMIIFVFEMGYFGLEYFDVLLLRCMSGEGGRAQWGVGALPADCSFAAGLLVPFLLPSERSFLFFSSLSTPSHQCLITQGYNVFMSYQEIGTKKIRIIESGRVRDFGCRAFLNLPTFLIILPASTIMLSVDLSDFVNGFHHFPDFHNKQGIKPTTTIKFNS